jgi:hypothetical protein
VQRNEGGESKLTLHGTHPFVTATDSVAATRSNVAPAIFRAITRTVLFDHTAALSSLIREWRWGEVNP